MDELITSLEGDEYALEEMNIAARRQEVDEQMEESIAHVTFSIRVRRSLAS